MAEKHYISGTAIRNYILKDPLIDWLDMYAPKDLQNPVSEIDEEKYLCTAGNNFERDIVTKLTLLFSKHMVTINDIGREGYTRENFEKTKLAIKQQIPIIEQAVLFNDKNNTCGIADLLVRDDYVNKLVDFHIKLPNYQKENQNAHYYVVVDIKWTTLNMAKGNIHIRNTGRIPSYKTQLYIYNQALSEIQGFNPNMALILAKGYKNIVTSDTFEQYGVIDYTEYDSWVEHETNLALSWITELRERGSEWNPLKPHRWELYPNMSNHYDGKWSQYKYTIAREIGELTLLWNVGFKNRMVAFEQGIYSFKDERCTADKLDIKSELYRNIIDRMIFVNKCDGIMMSYKGTPYLPTLQNEKCKNYFVDFETIDSIVFMIGVGFINNENEWEFQCFKCNEISFSEELRIFNEFNHFTNPDNDPDVENVFYHWSSAEVNNSKQFITRLIENNENRNGLDFYINNEWCDLYKLFIDCGFVINGSFDFKLKNVTNALDNLKLISCQWPTAGPQSGFEAMVMAKNYYSCNENGNENGNEISTMTMIEKYNEIDCKSMCEIYKFLMKLVALC